MTYDCKLCSFTSDTKYNYKRHLKSKRHMNAITISKVSLVNQDIMCNKCGTKFSHINNLYRHKKKSCKGVMIKPKVENTYDEVQQCIPIDNNVIDLDENDTLDDETIDSNYDIESISNSINQNYNSELVDDVEYMKNAFGMVAGKISELFEKINKIEKDIAELKEDRSDIDTKVRSAVDRVEEAHKRICHIYCILPDESVELENKIFSSSLPGLSRPVKNNNHESETESEDEETDSEDYSDEDEN